MDRVQLNQLLVMIFCEHEVVITDDREALWFRMFEHVPYDKALEAAKRMLLTKTFGPPKVSDFAEALAAVEEASQPTWIEAWEEWRRLARKWGYYEAKQAYDAYVITHPLGAKALGGASGAREWFNAQESQVSTLRAQFRSAYEALQDRQKKAALTPSEPVPKRIEARSKQPEVIGTIVQSLLEDE